VLVLLFLDLRCCPPLIVIQIWAKLMSLRLQY
jgi:hypothetical protein